MAAAADASTTTQWAMGLPKSVNEMVDTGFLILTVGATAAPAVLVADDRYTTRQFAPSTDWARYAYANRYLVQAVEGDARIFTLEFVSSFARAPFTSSGSSQPLRFGVSADGWLMVGLRYLTYDPATHQLQLAKQPSPQAIRPRWVPTTLSLANVAPTTSTAASTLPSSSESPGQALQQQQQQQPTSPPAVKFETLNTNGALLAAGLTALLGAGALGVGLLTQHVQQQMQQSATHTLATSPFVVAPSEAASIEPNSAATEPAAPVPTPGVTPAQNYWQRFARPATQQQ
jgi:hypothetical protein